MPINHNRWQIRLKDNARREATRVVIPAAPGHALASFPKRKRSQKRRQTIKDLQNSVRSYERLILERPDDPRFPKRLVKALAKLEARICSR